MNASITDPSDDGPARRGSSAATWLVAATCAIGLTAWFRIEIADTARGLAGLEVPYRPVHPPNLAAIDLAAVHGELWTDWVIAASQDDADARRGAEQALRTAIAADANLAALFAELATLVGPNLTEDRARKRVLWIVGAWNDYLDDNGAGWFLDASIRLEPSVMFFAMTYRIVGDGDGTVAGERKRVRVLDRIDTLNLRELYSGYVSSAEQGAIVIGDRTIALALDRTWPAFGEVIGEAEMARLWRAFGPAIVREAENALSPSTIAVLRASATARADAALAREAIALRRECGSRFVITDLPWNGYDPTTLEGLDRWIEDGDCPAITEREVESLRRATPIFRAAPGLADALADLARWRARGVAVHELRHVADDLDLDDEDALPCAICPVGTPLAVRAEVSAYLAELAWSESPAVELLDACVTRSQGDSAHARAAEIVMDAGGWSCTEPPPADISTTARALEQRAFGRSDEIAVDPSFGAALSVED